MRERGQHELSTEGLGGTRWETHAVKHTHAHTHMHTSQRAWVGSDDDLLTPDGAATLLLSPPSLSHPQLIHPMSASLLCHCHLNGILGI